MTFNDLLLHNKSPPNLMLKTATIICWWMILQVRQGSEGTAHFCSLWRQRGCSGLEDPLLRWLIHTAHKMVLASAGSSTQSFDSSPHGCLDFLTVWWLGSQREEAETARLLKACAQKSPKSTSSAVYWSNQSQAQLTVQGKSHKLRLLIGRVTYTEEEGRRIRNCLQWAS